MTLRWQREITAAPRPFGLTHVQFVLLASTWWLGRRREQPTQAALPAHAGTDVRTASQTRTVSPRRCVDGAGDG